MLLSLTFFTNQHKIFERDCGLQVVQQLVINIYRIQQKKNNFFNFYVADLGMVDLPKYTEEYRIRMLRKVRSKEK